MRRVLHTFLPVCLFIAFPIDFQFDLDPNIPCNNTTGEPGDAADSLSSMTVYANFGWLRREQYLNWTKIHKEAYHVVHGCKRLNFKNISAANSDCWLLSIDFCPWT